MTLRDAALADIPAIARLWHDAWHESHAAHVPEAMLPLRTEAGFAARVPDLLAGIRLAEDAGGLLGFCIVTDDELDQLFTAPRARGTGTASALIEDAEARMAAAGVRQAHLFVIEQNPRARRFYEKHGWRNFGAEMGEFADPSGGTFALEALKYVKNL